MKYLLPAAIVVATLLPSCRKVEVSGAQPDDTIYKEMLSCTGSRNYDSSALATALQGEWKEQWMEYGGARHIADSDLHVTFTPEGRYSMLVNGRTMSAGAWSVTKAESFSWAFVLKMNDTLAGYGGLPGRILLCDDRLFMNDTYHEPNFGNMYFTRVR
jgi:hypothetical protein